MRGVWTAAQVRAAEDVLLARTPDGVLMRRAAFGLALRARQMLAGAGGGLGGGARVAGRRVGLLVGAGNNGGDALWAGAELRRRGVGVDAVLLDPPRAHAAGLAALRRAGGRVWRAEDGAELLAAADLVLDGIVGISGRGPLRPVAAALVAAVERAGVPILAVDVPSGVDVDTGAVAGPAVTATATVTFGGLKPAHVLAAARCGPVRLVDIGLGPVLPEPFAELLDAADVAATWPVPGPADDKYTQGVTGVAAGSATYPGAGVLAAGAAVLATSGMVRYAGSCAERVRERRPEVVATSTVEAAGRVQAWVVGPGIGTDGAGRDALSAVLERAAAEDAALCVDADAITLLAADTDLRAALRGRRAVITPHDREFERIAGEVGADRVAAARRAAAELGVTVLLKGNATVVAAPDGRASVHPARTSWAATAGSGDVLAGVVGALLAAGAPPWWAAGSGAYVHACAAEIAAAGAPAPASALLEAVPAAVRAVRGV